jgi:tyrosinase
MKPAQRKAYTDAVLCLQSKPSRIAALNASLAPGAKTMYDDYVAIHINQTLSIHATVS